MDDNVKNVSQNTSPMVQDDQAQVQPVVAPVQPVAPAGSVNKEAGPVGRSDSDFIKPSETEPQVDKDLKEAGVETESDKPTLTFEHKDLGISHVGANITPVTQSSASVQLPMTEEEIGNKLKTGQNDDSERWLAGLLNKIMKAIGF
jgi:hypothetical protein